MSLIIKDMNMPKSCHDCAMRYIAIGLDFECVFTYDDVGDCIERRHANCPLEEVHTPHGRLIDAYKLMKVIEDNDYTLRSCLNTVDRGMFTIGIKQAIDESPTIIEAEQGDG